MDQEIRNKLRNVVTKCRKLLEDSISQELEGTYGIFARKDQVTADPNARMTHLSEEEQIARKDILDHFAHIKARGFKPKDALDQLIREIAFTHLNRLCAYKMMEAREVYVGGQKFREAVSRGVNSNGVKFYLAEHEEDERLFNTGQQDVAYRHFLDWLGGALSDEIGVLFNPNDPANRLYPRQKTLDDVLDLLNGGGIKAEETGLREQWPLIWSQDETIGWVYQYFTPKELRDQARKESQAPRNSYELAFRNQFFTPRYVVEFLTDNTLGRIWYEMRKGDTRLKDQCRYMVRRPTEIFLKDGEQPPKDTAEGKDDLSQEELLKLPVHIPHRPKKDPRELKILDPACGSGHFLLYCFDLLLTIYEEAYADPDLGPALKQDYPTLDALKRDVPRLILAHNLHGIDIDLRASQIAALALWLRCQRAYQEMGLKKDRPKITRSNFVCAEPMPGEEQMLKEFVSQLEPKVLGQVVEVVFDKMKLAGEAGSLLKIEEEIRDAIREAKRQFSSGGISIQQSLFDKPTEPVVKVFSVKDITDAQFFESAEAQVIESLRSYAEKAQNGQRLQRRLFTEDSVRGFAFVDLCQRRYDVVLMNPPFGGAALTAKAFCDAAYQMTKADIGFSFVERGSALLHPDGRIGAITSRVLLANDSLESWRHTRFLGGSSLRALVDLGYGVLDEALVECAMYIIQPHTSANTDSFFFRVLDERDKRASIEDFFVKDQLTNRALVIWRHLHLFDRIPGKILCYWLPNGLLTSIADARNLRSEGGNARHGLQTTDDFRFLRLAWEVAPTLIGRGRKWVHFAKGGEYQPFWDDIHLTLNWEDDGAELKNFVSAKSEKTLGVGGWSRWINAWDDYFKPGLTFPERTTSDFSPRVLPANCIFSATGEAIIFSSNAHALCYLAGAYTRHFKLVVDAFVGSGDSSVSGSAANHYRSGLINMMPPPCKTLRSVSCDDLSRAVEQVRADFSTDETTRYFVMPPRGELGTGSLRSAAKQRSRQHLLYAVYLSEISRKVERDVSEYLRFDEMDSEVVGQVIGVHPMNYPDANTDGNDHCAASFWMKTESELVSIAVQRWGARRQLTKKSYFGDRRLELICHILQNPPGKILAELDATSALGSEILNDVASANLSYCVGGAFGRWDVRLSTGKRELPIIPDPFAPLPACSPGMLQSSDGLPARPEDVSKDYPLYINWDGILVDDPDPQADIIRRVRQILEIMWNNWADDIEKEACEILGVKELRDYFRKPGKGGFWDDHISRYSKSRRKAPIYWLLQSSKKNYALWLYYHRLDKDLLFKALVNYVEPKIRLETSRLESLRSQKAAMGESGKEAKRIAKEVEKQEDFLSELRDFEDKLRRAANLHLDPDLNDGVVLNIAPLWELVPWKEAKIYWDELMEGKYEWSSIGKQLRQKGLVK